MYMTLSRMYSNGHFGSLLMIKDVYLLEICYPFVGNNERAIFEYFTKQWSIFLFALMEYIAWQKVRFTCFAFCLRKGLNWLLQVDNCRLVTPLLSTFTQVFIARGFYIPPPLMGYYSIVGYPPPHTNPLSHGEKPLFSKMITVVWKTTSDILVERYCLGNVLNHHNRHTRCHKLNWGVCKGQKLKHSKIPHSLYILGIPLNNSLICSSGCADFLSDIHLNVKL